MDVRWDSYSRFPGSGKEFERYIGTLFEDLGYEVELTPATNDYGVDLLLNDPSTKERIAVQAKFYNHSALGNSPIQEVIAGLAFYKTDKAWVVTNGRFSANAINLAKANGVRLIDNNELNRLIEQVQGKLREGYVFDREVDFSGFDTFADPSLLAIEHSTGNPRKKNTPIKVNNSPRITQIVEEPTYNKNDVKVRWGCSIGFIDKQIHRGMPMIKLPNGRWSINESELLSWEARMQNENIQKRRLGTIQVTIMAIGVIIVFVILAIALVRFLPINQLLT
jgi:Predicted endonuclease distantly related to archaeal Holliday junction resolvase and Mrr-like restriction enzymes